MIVGEASDEAADNVIPIHAVATAGAAGGGAAPAVPADAVPFDGSVAVSTNPDAGGATRAKLYELRDLLIVALIDALKGSGPAPKASTLNVARAFLADQGVTADNLPGNPREATAGLQSLLARETLPFPLADQVPFAAPDDDDDDF